MAMMTGGQALVKQLKREGIDTIFGLPGVQMDWVFDAIHEERASFNLYHPRHEQACVYMADGSARASGKIAVALMVPGPGDRMVAGICCCRGSGGSMDLTVAGNLMVEGI